MWNTCKLAGEQSQSPDYDRLPYTAKRMTQSAGIVLFCTFSEAIII